MSDWLKKGFIDQVKGALNRHNGSGGGTSGSTGGGSGGSGSKIVVLDNFSIGSDCELTEEQHAALLGDDVILRANMGGATVDLREIYSTPDVGKSYYSLLLAPDNYPVEFIALVSFNSPTYQVTMRFPEGMGGAIEKTAHRNDDSESESYTVNINADEWAEAGPDMEYIITPFDKSSNKVTMPIRLRYSSMVEGSEFNEHIFNGMATSLDGLSVSMCVLIVSNEGGILRINSNQNYDSAEGGSY